MQFFLRAFTADGAKTPTTAPATPPTAVPMAPQIGPPATVAAAPMIAPVLVVVLITPASIKMFFFSAFSLDFFL